MIWWLLGGGLGGLLILVAIHDLTQNRHAVLRNFPIIGHFRYWLEAVGPELRQYIVTNNDEERPFSRDQRRWIYTSAKGINSLFGFGTDNDLEQTPNLLVIKHATFPLAGPPPGSERFDPTFTLPAAKVLGGPRGRSRAFRPRSVVNLSGMSYGSLSANAVEAINRGCQQSGALHNTGEGGITPHHGHGAGLVWQIGTGYFGCRDPEGNFSLPRLVEMVQQHPVRALEIKLSQGAKPGKGGILPAAKITPEISRIRGIPMGKPCISPPAHTAFRDADELLDFVEQLAEATGLPVGIKSAVGETHFWHELAALMEPRQRGVDFIAIDGGEGGTGAAPLVFADHVSLPFKVGMGRVYRIFAEKSLHEDIIFIGSGRLGLPDTSVFAFALGCDMVHVAREGMMAIGCIQAQRCHNGHCPTGVATQNRWLVRGLNPQEKSQRLGTYVCNLRRELIQLSHAAGEPHPAFIGPQHLEILEGNFHSRPLGEVFDYDPTWSLPKQADLETLRWIMEDPRHRATAFTSSEAGSETGRETGRETTTPAAAGVGG